jgi:hypothetical protein
MSTALSLQLASAVTESVAGVCVVAGRVAGVVNGVFVGGSVAVTNLGVVFDGVGVDMETQDARANAAVEAVNNKLLMFLFQDPQ